MDARHRGRDAAGGCRVRGALGSHRGAARRVRRRERPRRRAPGAHPGGVRDRTPVLLRVPAPDPDLLRHEGQPDAGARQHRRGGREPHRRRRARSRPGSRACRAWRWGTPRRTRWARWRCSSSSAGACGAADGRARSPRPSHAPPVASVLSAAAAFAVASLFAAAVPLERPLLRLVQVTLGWSRGCLSSPGPPS